MKTRKIKQMITFSTSPQDLYELLLSGKKMSVIQGAKSTMTKRATGKLTVFDGYCHGKNMELTEGSKIVQAWYFKEKGWPDDHFSICTFSLEPVAKGTRLTFEQTGVPAVASDGLKKGWYEYYWEPIKAYLKME
jgi:activator of HSP90 ATPase